MAKFGYARCSTAKEKQDIERQVRELLASGAELVFHEYASGVKRNRAELKKLFEKVKTGDTVSVTEVSRLTRSTGHMYDLIGEVEGHKLRLECGTLVTDCTVNKIDPMNKAMLLIMAVFAEFERDITVERIKSGLKNSKEKGTTMGRPKKTAADVPKSVLKHLADYQDGKFGIAEYARRAGFSRPALYKYLSLLGVERVKPKSQKVTTVPAKVKRLYPKFIAGDFNKAEYAKRAGISRPALDKYLGIIQEG